MSHDYLTRLRRGQDRAILYFVVNTFSMRCELYGVCTPGVLWNKILSYKLHESRLLG